ncbi:MAG TPA: S8/S53 family peptidase [Saprospiraceae bacterium]|mgnify:CR=1 FL=1|nr:S8/S53 family peptidase [Saprospiraceae bacterium]HPI05273.1 S8/S53 family peptidase [Saprospiraceae bacterium]
MKKSTLLLFAALLLAVNACRKQESTTSAGQQAAPDPGALDEFIRAKLETEEQFLWSWASDEQIWTALSNSDFVLSVGYQPAGFSNIDDKMHLLDLQSPEWKAAHDAIFRIVLDSERSLNPALRASDILAFEENAHLPVFDVYVKNPQTITALRNSSLLRYAEPIGYEPYMTTASERSSSGCGSNTPQTGLVAGSDYTVITPNCKQSWNYSYHNIAQAWNNGNTGAGTTVMIIDSGCSTSQDNLGSAFNQGSSSGRTVTKYVTLPGATSPNDPCGHGTSMMGACTAPRGTDGNAVGVAYNANLVAVRGADDVYLDTSNETVGVSNAYTLAGNTASVKIVSMSMGRLLTANQIRDAIIYAYNNGKLIFCAAGTSFSWTAWFAGVIFPASMTQAVAVTGIKTNLTSRCSACHSGSKVDFVVVMEKNSDGHPLSLADYGNDPSTVGGSSVSTATTAGIAALVWAKYPSWTRQQVFDRLKTSSNYYPSRNSEFGWGRINAQTATQ